MSRRPTTDLTKQPHTFSAWLERNLDHLMSIKDPQIMRDYIAENMGEVSVSEKYLRKFFMEFDNTKNYNSILKLITDKILYGSGQGVI